ncbi:secondary thiamine-phosphate synthase enzyme YjbQ [Brooklawnia cerclae]|uniref:Secondary thiamine-phosphate synthase enzyme n=1 Tax=Brooklawnia cerclae TaxID=349934 RepID=A0ABX0SMG3_9ACTN|nr:secondary thiamine-phosphate synthase enzyme [Brooklawnia cerclae]
MKITSVGGRPSFHRITDEVRAFIAESGINDGVCVVSTHHTTCSVMTQEDSIDLTYNGLEYLQQDLWDVFEQLIPTTRAEGQYRHPGPELTEFSREHGESKPETLNTDAHLRSVFIGRSETLPVVDGTLDLGSFGHIYFIDFDHTRPREREVSITVMGD